MKELDTLFIEALDGLSNNSMYGARSEAPRKDFSPQSGSKGYGFPYQTGNSASINLGPSQSSANTPLIPWELNGIDADIADSVVYLASALSKISRTLADNNTLSETQMQFLGNYEKKLEECLNLMQDFGNHVITVINLAQDLPPQTPPQTPPSLQKF